MRRTATNRDLGQVPNSGGIPMASSDISGRSFSELDHRAHLRRAMIASTVGTTIEWYDFLLYGQVTALVFGKLFFPKSDPLVGVLEAFAVFFSDLSAGRSARRFSATGATGSAARQPLLRHCW